MESSATNGSWEVTERWREIRRLCRERQESLSPAERDELLQLWIAQGMTYAQRAEATRMLCRAAAALARRGEEKEREADGDG